MDNEQQKKTVLRKIFNKVWNKTDSNKVINKLINLINEVLYIADDAYGYAYDVYNQIAGFSCEMNTGYGGYNNIGKFKNYKFIEVTSDIPKLMLWNNYSQTNKGINITYDGFNVFDNAVPKYNTFYKKDIINIIYEKGNTFYNYNIDLLKLANFINTLQSTMALSADEELTDDDKVVTIRELTQEEINKINKHK